MFKELGHQQAIQPPRRGGAGVQGTALSFAPRVTWRAASPLSGGPGASAAALGARARRPARSAARSLVEPAGADRGWRMALRGPAASGPGSRGSLDEAGAEGREAAALSAAGVTPEDEEEDDGRRGLLRWDGFSAWLHCVCVVGFDLELGQAVEVRPGRTLSPPLARPGPGGRASGRGLQPLQGSTGRRSSGPSVGGSWAAARGEKFFISPS